MESIGFCERRMLNFSWIRHSLRHSIRIVNSNLTPALFNSVRNYNLSIALDLTLFSTGNTDTAVVYLSCISFSNPWEPNKVLYFRVHFIDCGFPSMIGILFQQNNTRIIAFGGVNSLIENRHLLQFNSGCKSNSELHCTDPLLSPVIGCNAKTEVV